MTQRISQGTLPSSRAVGSPSEKLPRSAAPFKAISVLDFARPDSRFAQYLAIAVGLSSAILDGVSDLHSSEFNHLTVSKDHHDTQDHKLQ
ncbi:hypothetical protein L3Y34_011463 [Caenorhabditis briggsae]|uniref:Uncharacterized protein n=1 Tax=Caenorhabditis briggsae TaxID=6238 RepID=A0AAE8ZPZ1_CAEBR|nr:hypothetical protein L3Y34_011463 [Caenorhabditis briggsae]